MGKRVLSSRTRDDQILVEKISYLLNHEKIEKASIAARQLAESYSLERTERDENILHQKCLEGGNWKSRIMVMVSTRLGQYCRSRGLSGKDV